MGRGFQSFVELPKGTDYGYAWELCGNQHLKHERPVLRALKPWEWESMQNSLRRPWEACAARKPLLRDMYNTGAESGSEGLIGWDCLNMGFPKKLSFHSLIGKITEDCMGSHEPSWAVHPSTSPCESSKTHRFFLYGQGLGLLNNLYLL